MRKVLIVLAFLACGISGISGIRATAQTRCTELYKLPCEEQAFPISPTRYNWKRVANNLTKGCETDIEKIEAIYDWITRNIAYDTSNTIRTADKCFHEKKGVCQGYCELFYRIAEAAELRVETVSGLSRDTSGNVSDTGHAWIFAYTHDNYGILLDPTWDAGAVSGGEFIRETYHRAWFGVAPQWMILTHFPDDPSFQLLPETMSEEEFRSLNYSFSFQHVYGFDVNEIYTRARNHTLSMPEVYSYGVGDIEVLDAPLQAKLVTGTPYTFRIRMKTEKELFLVADDWYSNLYGDWAEEGDGIYSIVYTSLTPDEINLGLREPGKTGSAFAVLCYQVVSQPVDEAESESENIDIDSESDLIYFLPTLSFKN